jgi:hypothetical protein
MYGIGLKIELQQGKKWDEDSLCHQLLLQNFLINLYERMVKFIEKWIPHFCPNAMTDNQEDKTTG